MITLPNHKYITDVLNEKQLEFLACHLPEPDATTGRPAYSNQELLPGILRVLRSGSRWRDLDQGDLPSGISHWRRLRYWQEKLGLELIWGKLTKLLAKTKPNCFSTVNIDGTLIASPAFKDTTSYSGKHKRVGTKVSLLVSENGLPLSCVFASGSTHDLPLAQPTVEKISKLKLTDRIKQLLADRGYVSAAFGEYLTKQNITPIVAKKRPTLVWKQKVDLLSRGEEAKLAAPIQDQTLKKRFVVERTNAWSKSFRRLRFRFDYSLLSFSAFQNLAYVVMLVRRLV